MEYAPENDGLILFITFLLLSKTKQKVNEKNEDFHKYIGFVQKSFSAFFFYLKEQKRFSFVFLTSSFQKSRALGTFAHALYILYNMKSTFCHIKCYIFHLGFKYLHRVQFVFQIKHVHVYGIKFLKYSRIFNIYYIIY